MIFKKELILYLINTMSSYPETLESQRKQDKLNISKLEEKIGSLEKIYII